ncbi:MAG: efflux RND transporter periplasmic adaptor subunit [Melioribacteraceae bacterium]|nr:efflux RND transporter periplasmic adaptor subunit [Melioribacteraceae bacterium]MCF8355018.1 efflux RND transporter periplasmic adaptor subunit [Melioribacteraceae bacterium]MCF8394343.1 efflux RND transporter periplasmic adaptor subunit [Melioribacteraceae bacterium]MCF8420022.1 efflux RND transporter periplasmic adaptor subunit [Melioribacteraceae bacterium]
MLKLTALVTKAAKEMTSVPVISSGKLSSAQESNLSFKIPGIIKSIQVKEGDKVNKDQILAQLDPTEIESNVSKAKNGVEKAKRDYERIKNLFEENVVTLEQLQNSKTALDVAESDYRIAKFNQEHAVIKAPSYGRILHKFMEENEIINAGAPLLRFGNADSGWEINASVSDVEIVKLNAGDMAKVNFDAVPNTDFNAVVTEVGQAADPRTGTYKVTLKLKNPAKNLASGFICKVKIFPQSKNEFIFIPIEALVDAEMKSGYVFIPEGKRAKKIKIATGSIIGDKVTVTGGMEEGDMIISSGAEYLHDGSKIKIVEKQ